MKDLMVGGQGLTSFSFLSTVRLGLRKRSHILRWTSSTGIKIICHCVLNVVWSCNLHRLQADFIAQDFMIELWPEHISKHLRCNRFWTSVRFNSGTWTSMTIGIICETTCSTVSSKSVQERSGSGGSSTSQRQHGMCSALAKICGSNIEKCKGPK